MRTKSVALVTGGTGFIGSRITRRLLAEGWSVRLLSAGGKQHRIQPANALAEWYGVGAADIARASEGATHYFNFAVVYDRQNISDETIQRVNVELPRRVMSELRVRGDKPICVLGDTFFRKFSPDATAQVRYTRSKIAQWEVAQDLVADGRVAAAMIRIEQVYGPGEALTKVFPSIVARMLRQEKRISLTSGIQTRDFIHVDDVVEAALLIAKCHESGARVIDCGSGTSVSVRKVFERLHELTGSDSLLGFGDLKQDQGIEDSKANISWLKKEGWLQKVSLDEGLIQLVEDVRSRL